MDVVLPLTSLNMPTAVASEGVNPSNQIALFPVVVPVLPATGRAPSEALCPVPTRTTCRMASVTSAVWSLSNAGVSCFRTAQSMAPLLSRTSLIRYGVARTPCAATVAYALAMSITRGEAVPRILV